MTTQGQKTTGTHLYNGALTKVQELSEGYEQLSVSIHTY